MLLTNSGFLLGQRIILPDQIVVERLMKWTLLTHCWDAAGHAPWSVNETPAKHSKEKASENLSIVFQLTRISVKLISPFLFSCMSLMLLTTLVKSPIHG